MKFQPKRFVVEVKRGTNRASFASPDASADRFSDAEAALFGSPNRDDAKRAPAWPAEAAALRRTEAPSGRILRSLVEPPPPVVEEPPPARRGRKPGSKNKPKPQLEAAPPSAEAERPRRGRKPGSKNKPKPPAVAALPSTALPSTAGSDSLTAAMRSYGFADDAPVWSMPAAPEPRPTRAEAAAPAPAGHDPVSPSASLGASPDAAPAQPRVRLRDRSSILKRYVLDTEPRPGQLGAIRARRRARAV